MCVGTRWHRFQVLRLRTSAADQLMSHLPPTSTASSCFSHYFYFFPFTDFFSVFFCPWSWLNRWVPASILECSQRTAGVPLFLYYPCFSCFFFGKCPWLDNLAPDPIPRYYQVISCCSTSHHLFKVANNCTLSYRKKERWRTTIQTILSTNFSKFYFFIEDISWNLQKRNKYLLM